MSAAEQANIWSRPPARPTGISLPWPAKGCATKSHAVFKKPSGGQKECRFATSKSEPTAASNPWRYSFDGSTKRGR